MSTAVTTEPHVGSNRWYLAAAPIARALAHLCVPMAAALIVSAIYNVINAGFIGSLHETALLAAVTLGSPVLGLMMAVGNLFGVGGGAMISRLLGEAEHEPGQASQIKRVASFSLWGAVVVGIVLGAAGLLGLAPLVNALGANAESVHATRSFIAVLVAFTPAFAAAICLEQLVRAEGAARQAMIGLITSTVASLVLDVLLILVLRWGVAGAATSTGVANLIGAGYFAVWLTRHSEHVNLSPRWFTLTSTIAKPVLGVGASTLLQFGIIIASSLVMNNLAGAYGDGPLAALGVAVRIAQVPEFLVMGVTLGVLPLLAYSYGKGDRGRLTAALRGSAITVGAIAVFLSGLVFLFRDRVFSAFVADRSLLDIGVTVLAAQLVAMIANGFTGLFTSLFQATAKATAATALSTAQGLLFFPLVFLGNLWFGLDGIIWALAVAECAVAVIALGLWLTLRQAIDRGLAEGSIERAEAAAQEAEA